MFGLFKPQSEVQKLIKNIGFDKAADHYAEVVLQKIPDGRVFHQFILEEMDAAQSGNDAAQAFVREVGIPLQDYKGAMRRSFPEVDGPNGPQQTLLRICMQLGSNVDRMVAMRVGIVRRLLKKAPFGPVTSQAGA